MLFAAPWLHVHINISLISAYLIRHSHTDVEVAFGETLLEQNLFNFSSTSHLHDFFKRIFLFQDALRSLSILKLGKTDQMEIYLVFVVLPTSIIENTF